MTQQGQLFAMKSNGPGGWLLIEVGSYLARTIKFVKLRNAVVNGVRFDPSIV